MQFKLTVTTDNAAFQVDDGDLFAWNNELARILKRLASDLTMNGFFQQVQGPFSVQDVNGNRVGEWEVTE